MEAALKAAEFMHEAVGTTVIRKGNRLERLFRDAHTISQHAFASAARYDSVALVILGQQSDWGFFYL